ncbi:MAG: hypothetical protein LBP22_04390 [Deltaproteobacteria bacterium]|nr:hypothetical protein [Deltaproteobacteria bacterium]
MSFSRPANTQTAECARWRTSLGTDLGPALAPYFYFFNFRARVSLE